MPFSFREDYLCIVIYWVTHKDYFVCVMLDILTFTKLKISRFQIDTNWQLKSCVYEVFESQATLLESQCKPHLHKLILETPFISCVFLWIYLPVTAGMLSHLWPLISLLFWQIIETTDLLNRVFCAMYHSWKPGEETPHFQCKQVVLWMGLV